MEHKCKCKNGGRGHNFIPDRITVSGEGGREISHRDLVCHHCVYKKRGDTSSCLRFDKKPPEVLSGGKCEAFLNGDIDGKNHGCQNDCGDCGNCGNDCGSCGGECSGCGGCEH